MKTVATFLLLAGAAGYFAPETLAGPEPTKKSLKVSPKKKLNKLFGRRLPESAYAKALRRNELLR
ncbi:hypothetical protein ACFPAF_10030 [Hymenobacter endophyticus]|uniref:Uncharacterized protein n=1 Tax=Hymenobacter endophyticus TaxID=3076335 RepID=A0ABU3TH85_9BACT|nr:hypothetical protein [Hymenobacter endophyticus]MDU0370731.1 hypothetical protein [Hymenobacter endophyticus]